MTINEVSKKFDTEEKCHQYLLEKRFAGKPICLSCKSERIRFDSTEKRFVCNNCKKKFSVIADTIFERTRYPLTDWFKIIVLMLNSKQGISAMNIMRNMGCSYKTAWYLAMRVRCGMIDPCIELQNIVEMDEAYVGGKPRKKGKMESPELEVGDVQVPEQPVNKRGRGTKKTPVVGIVERKGKVVLQVGGRLTSKFLLNMLRDNVKMDNAIVMTDDYKGYIKFDELVEHLVVNHSKGEYSRGIVHTNTLEGFWAIVKNSIRGNYIALSKKYLPLYLVQAQYIYNRRDETGSLFDGFITQAVKVDREQYLVDYKPTKDVRQLVYKPKNKVKC